MAVRLIRRTSHRHFKIMIATSTQNCIFNTPVRLFDGMSFEDWEYSKLICTSTISITNPPAAGSNSTSTQNVYYNGFSSGELVLTIFVFLIFVILLFGSILKPFWGRQL